MARVTVEDCLQHVSNRFNLVIIAAKRARQISMGMSEPKVPWENDKPSVVALREIADGLVGAEILQSKGDLQESAASVMMVPPAPAATDDSAAGEEQAS